MFTRKLGISSLTAPAQRTALLAGGLLALASSAASAQFAAESPIGTGSSVTGIASADFDSDGDLDVVVARSSGQVVGWHANLGGGVFGAVQAIEPQAHSADTALALDFDHDGDMDFISVLDFYTPELGQDHQVLLFENAGDGTFSWQTLLYFGIDSLADLALGDLEGDGDQDLFYASWGDDTLSVLKNTHAGSAWMWVPISDAATATREIRPADVDGDGDLDVVVTSTYLEEISWFENLDGTEAFGSKQMIDGDVPGVGALDAADLDADGDLDLLVATAIGGTYDLRWYENLGAGAFGGSKVISTVFPGLDLQGVDIEGDGDIDVLAAEFSGPTWYPNDGEAHFGPRQVIGSSSVALSLIDAPDLSGDGVPDVLFGTSSEGKLAWHEGLSPAHWTDLGFALAGSAGLPSLAGSGTLAAGSAGSLALTSAKPLAFAGLFLSLTSTPAPFKCGTLAPVPVASSVVLSTGAAGSVVLPWAAWPAGLSGASVYLQYAIQDAGAACGFALSNALRADPP